MTRTTNSTTTTTATSNITTQDLNSTTTTIDTTTVPNTTTTLSTLNNSTSQTTHSTNPNYPAIDIINQTELYNTAKKVAYSAINYLSRMEGHANPELFKMLSDILNYDEQTESATTILGDGSDTINVAYITLVETADFKAAYQAVCRYIYQSKQRHIKHMFVDISEDADASELQDVNNTIAAAIKHLDAIPALRSIIEILTPMQRKVLHYVSLGYTTITIGKRLGISQPRVTQHMQAIQAKALTLYPNGLNDIF